MSLSATLTRVEGLENPVTLTKFRNLVDTTTVSVAGTAETQNIANGAVTAPKLATDAVTTAKIQDDAVTAAKIAADAVETAQIKDAAVATAKIADGAVTEAKIDPTLLGEIEELAHGGMFLGEVRMFCDSAVPTGFVLCDGGTYSHSDYPKVQAARDAGADPYFKYTGTSDYAAGRFSVPNLKNKFIRVWESGKSLTATVADTTKAHRHSLLAGLSNEASGKECVSMGNTTYPAGTLGGPRSTSAGSLVDKDSSGSNWLVGENTGAETAPVHMFLVFAVYIGLHA